MISTLLMLSCLAAPPAIQGETNVSQYKLVQLSVSDAPADAAILWDVYPEESADIREFSDGTFIFTGPPGTYRIKMRLINGRQVDTFRTIVTIGGDPNPPIPGPGPGPGPKPVEPVFPDGQFKLAKKAYDWAKQVNTANKNAEAISLSGAFSGCSAAIAAGTVKDVSSLLSLSRDSNRNALGSSADAWRPWFTSLKNELDALYASGALKSLDDHNAAFSEIASGLRSVK